MKEKNIIRLLVVLTLVMFAMAAIMFFKEPEPICDTLDLEIMYEDLIAGYETGELKSVDGTIVYTEDGVEYVFTVDDLIYMTCFAE